MTRSTFTGLLAALAAALVGAGWQIASRHGVTTTLGPLELAWLRYVVPAVLLAPLLLRGGWPAHLRPAQVVLLAATGGFPFGLLVLAGAQWAPAAHIGIFTSGAVPVFTAVACWIALGEPVRGGRWVGLLAVAAGIALMAGGAATREGAWRGDALFLLAAVSWAVHTVALRRSGLRAWTAAALVNAASACALVLALPWARPLRLLTAPSSDLLLQAAWQGAVAGMLGLVAYTVAVRRLGPSRASLSAAAVPLLTAFGAAAALGEPLDARTLGAGALMTAGIVLAGLSRPACLPPRVTGAVKAPRKPR